MIDTLTLDIQLLKKRTLEKQEQNKSVAQQAGQCDQIKNSAHFMSLSLTSKFNIVKNKTNQHNREIVAAVEGAKEDLEAERRNVEQMKSDIILAIQETENLKVVNREKRLELHDLEENQKTIKAMFEGRNKDMRRQLVLLQEVDVYFLAYCRQ